MSDFVKDLNRYGTILKDEKNDVLNTRTKVILYNDKKYILEMKNGNVTKCEQIEG